MEMRRLGKTGYVVSEIGLGCWQLGGDFGAVSDETSNAILAQAAELGVNFWDTADVYGGGLSERRIGGFSGKPDGLRVATKVGRAATLFPDTFSKDGVRASLVGSAERLGVEQLDLAQLHCVPAEVLRDGSLFEWMEAFKADGLIAHWGASVETIEEAFICLGHPGLATLQIIFNLFRQDAVEALLPKAKAADVGVIARLPLASGLLTGKFDTAHTFAPEDHRNYNRDGQAFSVGETFAGLPFETGVELADTLKSMVPQGMTLAQMALRWILDQDGISTIIAGVSRPSQLVDNVAAGEFDPLPAGLKASLAAFYRSEVRPHVRGEI